MKRNFERSIAKEAKTNPKAFYNYVNGNLKTRTGITNLETSNGKTTSDKEKAEALNRYFVSVFTREDISYIPRASNTRSHTTPHGGVKYYSRYCYEEIG